MICQQEAHAHGVDKDYRCQTKRVSQLKRYESDSYMYIFWASNYIDYIKVKLYFILLSLMDNFDNDCYRCKACDQCDGCDDCNNCKNCKKCTMCNECEYTVGSKMLTKCVRCSYCNGTIESSDCERCTGCNTTTHCTDCTLCSHCDECDDCKHSKNCTGCVKCDFCADCKNCSFCYGCTGLESKQWMINNEQYTPESYQEQIKTIIPEFVKSGGLPPDIIIEAITSKSIPDLKYKVKKAMQIQKDENNQIQQLTQQVEQLQEQLQNASKQLEQSQKQIEKLNQTKLQLEQQDLSNKYKLEWYKAQTDRDYKEATAEEQKRRTEVEIAQLYDGNPYNDKIRDL